MHKTTERFRECFQNLPPSVQKTATKNFELLKKNHPSLHFKKIGNFWSVRIGLNYRALAIKDQQDFIWVWIGSHKEYDELIGRHKNK